MTGIREEMLVFLLAFLTGAVSRLAYRGLCCLRSIIRHSLFVIQLEDILFWISTAFYFFVQIYHTNDGSIRWYFILGVVLGAVFLSVILWRIEKLHKKIYSQKLKKYGKNLAK